MHVTRREWSVEENDDEAMLQVIQDEQKCPVVGVILFHTPFTPYHMHYLTYTR